MIKVALLECKSGAIATYEACLAQSFIDTSLLGSVICRVSVCCRCTLKTQEFRTKDFVVRRAHSIEHQKCKYCLRRNHAASHSSYIIKKRKPLLCVTTSLLLIIISACLILSHHFRYAFLGFEYEDAVVGGGVKELSVGGVA